MGVIGASISAGCCASDKGKSWFALVVRYLQDAFPQVSEHSCQMNPNAPDNKITPISGGGFSICLPTYSAPYLHAPSKCEVGAVAPPLPVKEQRSHAGR